MSTEPQSITSPNTGLVEGSRDTRLVFVDVLRVAAVAFVVVHHAAQAYGPTGGFWPVHDQAQSDWFRPFYTANAAFGLALLFLIAGYFTVASYDRKGPARFLKERWARIGLPLSLFVLFVNTPAVYVLGRWPTDESFVGWLYNTGWTPIYLHLWFLSHLILYSVLYVAWRQFTQAEPKSEPIWPVPSHATITGFIAIVGSITWIIRIYFPIDAWVPLMWLIPAEPAHLTHYVSLFAVGTVAYRGDWLRKMPTRGGLIWLGIGLLSSISVYLVHALGIWNVLMASGGFNLSSLLRSMWETVIAVSLCIGLIVAFRQLFKAPHSLLLIVAALSFGAYILHPPIVVALQTAIEPLAWPAFPKFAFVAVLGNFLSFLVALWASRVPGLRTILGVTTLSRD